MSDRMVWELAWKFGPNSQNWDDRGHLVAREFWLGVGQTSTLCKYFLDAFTCVGIQLSQVYAIDGMDSVPFSFRLAVSSFNFTAFCKDG